MKHLLKIILFYSLVALLASCAPIMQPPLEPLGSGSANTGGGKYVPKVDNFQVILDTSYSMDDGGKNDFLAARDIVSRLNQAIPTDLKFNAGLRTFGHNSYQSKQPTVLAYGMEKYTLAGFHEGLSSVRYVGGPSPLAAALDAAGNDLKPASGKSALIVVSDGTFMDDATGAAKNLKAKMGKDFCIYTIALANENNGAGQDLLKTVADSGQCGFATTDAALAGDAKMAAFIESVFLAKPAPKPAPKAMAPRDSDGDSVTDDKDKCPDTPKGEFVDEVGCTLKMTLHINFDFDKAEIKPEFKPDLDKAAAYIKKNSYVPYILIAGHTDYKGTMEYNQKLSENRANAVRQYLIDNYGIDGKRLFAEGYGKLKPVASNTTEDGRYQNRRVEVVCCSLKPR